MLGSLTALDGHEKEWPELPWQWTAVLHLSLTRKPVNTTLDDPTGKTRPNPPRAMKQQSYFFVLYVLLASYKSYLKHIIKPQLDKCLWLAYRDQYTLEVQRGNWITVNAVLY